MFSYLYISRVVVVVLMMMMMTWGYCGWIGDKEAVSCERLPFLILVEYTYYDYFERNIIMSLF